MLKRKINIVFALDNNFVEQLAVAIASILINSDKNDVFNFYILDGGISESNKEKIKALKTIKNFEIKFIKIDRHKFNNLPTSGHIKSPTYYRIELPSLISLDKVLYLDCDIIVSKSLAQLYETQLSDNYAAVVSDILVNDINLKGHIKALGLKKYFNSGVILLNLKKMRDDDIQKKCFEFISKNKFIKYHDQDVLNKLFKEKVLWVNSKWNFQYNYGKQDIKKCYKDSKAEIALLHFACARKPWGDIEWHPGFWMWHKYLQKTPYRLPKFSLLRKYLKIKAKQTIFNKVCLMIKCITT